MGDHRSIRIFQNIAPLSLIEEHSDGEDLAEMRCSECIYRGIREMPAWRSYNRVDPI